MKSRLLAMGIAVLGYAIIDGNVAKADKYFNPSGSSAQWDAANAWDADCNDSGDNSTPPTASEAVIICADKTAVVDDGDDVALKVTLQTPISGATLIQITPSGAVNAVLTLGSSTTELTSTLESGTAIQLKDDTDGTLKARLVFASASHIMSGSSAEILGEDNLAEIAIGDGLTFTNSTVIKGRLQIKDDGAVNSSFMNSGKVIANSASGTLDVSPSTSIDDAAGSDRWQVTASGAMLRLLEDAPAMEGDFVVSNGTLRAGDDVGGDAIGVYTTGALSHIGGKIIAGASDSFVFNGS